MQRMGLIKRRASTKAQVSVNNFDEMRSQYLFDIKTAVEISFDLE